MRLESFKSTQHILHTIATFAVVSFIYPVIYKDFVTNVQQANWTEMNWTVLFCVIINYRLNSIIVSLFILLIIYQSVFDRVISRLSCLKPVAYIISVVSHIGVSE